MREDLLKRLQTWNGGDLIEVPEEPIAAGPSNGKRKRTSEKSRAADAETVIAAPGELAAGSGAIFSPIGEQHPTDPDSLPPRYAALAQLLPGFECDRARHGRHYCVETRLHDLADWRDLGEGFRAQKREGSTPRAWGRMASLPPERLLFFDIETAGLGDAAVFLIGLMVWDGEHFLIRQLLARAYEEEPSILAETAEILHRAGALVSFNGKSFDLPFLKNRFAAHGFPPPAGREHADLLHHARRRWRSRFPDCRLQTLEARVCGRVRVDDIPSREIPLVYYQYARSGDPRPLLPILHHNLLDLITMAELILVMGYGSGG
ncbi:MAG: ribonuclease H-like domain-containing protein [Armatimonadetes bacterium]|nr:ribonuclease H-like domain-containing protein [Armatimonadota bacterium]